MSSVVFKKTETFEKNCALLRDLAPRQLWMLLAAAYQALAADEVKIRWFSAVAVEADARIEELENEVKRLQRLPNVDFLAEATKREARNEELIEQLRQLVGIDPLTKVLNRYLIGDALEEAVGFCRRMNLPLSVLFLDIDNFRNVNNNAEIGGHQAGDAVLVQLVERLRTTLRRYDKIGRYGGEEFIVSLQGVNLEKALVVAERIRTLVAGEPFEFAGHKIPVTVSIGVAERQTSEMAFSLIGAADRAMLRAKRTGKNCVVSVER